jgi:hypothetical protein
MHATSHGQRGWVPSLIALLLALLLALTLQSGAVALKWGYSDGLVAWRAAGALGGVHLLSATWEAYALQQ